MKKNIIKGIFLLVLTLMTVTVYCQSSVRNQRGRQSNRTQQQQSGRQSAANAIQPQRPAVEESDETKPDAQTLQQQSATNRRERMQLPKNPDRTADLTERARIKNELNSREPQHVVWLREIYRVINLDSANNAALKFPAQPTGDRVNLFTLIFRLLQENRIMVYNYVADRETDFSDNELARFEDILKNNQIPYSVEGEGENVNYKVDDIDVPSGDVTEYLVKEGWYFDEAIGTFRSQVIALCPTVVSIDYNDNSVHKTPFCWIPYENIRPYLQRTMLMTSDYNNAMVYTMDDYFTKRMYRGDIVKTVNMKNETLAQQVGNEPDALRKAQDSIDTQLKSFNRQLWVQPDSTNTATAKNTKTVSPKNISAKTKQTDTAKTTKTEKSTPSVTRSVRRKK
ncbi:MAG: gliding motility protein GldN [Dysgonamonadaceae bacterium]|jgi:gliding motility associated protien GldN|nr:gliding motility protein GldN [Dysgonamonadaceae bacterium]